MSLRISSCKGAKAWRDSTRTRCASPSMAARMGPTPSRRSRIDSWSLARSSPRGARASSDRATRPRSSSRRSRSAERVRAMESVASSVAAQRSCTAGEASLSSISDPRTRSVSSRSSCRELRSGVISSRRASSNPSVPSRPFIACKADWIPPRPAERGDRFSWRIFSAQAVVAAGSKSQRCKVSLEVAACSGCCRWSSICWIRPTRLCSNPLMD